MSAEKKKNSGMQMLLRRKGIRRFNGAAAADGASTSTPSQKLNPSPHKPQNHAESLSTSSKVDEGVRPKRTNNLALPKSSGVGSGNGNEALVLKGHDSPMTTPVKRSARLATPNSKSVEETKSGTEPSSLKQPLSTRKNGVSDESPKKSKSSSQKLICVDSKSFISSPSIKSEVNGPQDSTKPSQVKKQKRSALDSSDSDTDDFVKVRNGSSSRNPNRARSKSAIPKINPIVDSGSDIDIEANIENSRNSKAQSTQKSAVKKVVAQTPVKSKPKGRNHSKIDSKDEATEKQSTDNASRKVVNRTPSPRFHMAPPGDL